MKVDRTALTEQGLIVLNRQIVERLRFMNQARSHAKMLEFRVGDRVCFDPAFSGEGVKMSSPHP